MMIMTAYAMVPGIMSEPMAGIFSAHMHAIAVVRPRQNENDRNPAHQKYAAAIQRTFSASFIMKPVIARERPSIILKTADPDRIPDSPHSPSALLFFISFSCPYAQTDKQQCKDGGPLQRLAAFLQKQSR